MRCSRHSGGSISSTIAATGALQAYLRQAVQNRIRDELRRIDRRPIATELLEDVPATAASPLDSALDAERTRRYKQALATLSEADRVLVVARIEIEYTFQNSSP